MRYTLFLSPAIKQKINEEKYYLNRLFGDKEFQLYRVKKQQSLILKWKFLLKTF